MTPAEARERILRELPDSAVFGAQFRMNAARALLLPTRTAGKRTPFWLQRLKAKDLLAMVRQFDDFPIVAETYRDCLRDVLDLPHLEEVLERIQAAASGRASKRGALAGGGRSCCSASSAVHVRVGRAQGRTPASDALRAPRGAGGSAGERGRAERPAAAGGGRRSCGGKPPHRNGYQARSVEELAVFLEELGDLSEAESAAVCVRPPEGADTRAGAPAQAGGAGNPQAAAWLQQLADAGRVVKVAIPTAGGPEERWLAVELAGEYVPDRAGGGAAMRAADWSWPDPEVILRRYLRSSGPVTRQRILKRYAFPEEWLDGTLSRLVAARVVLKGHFTPGGALGACPPPCEEYCDQGLLERIHRRSLGLLRKEVQPVSLSQYAAFLTRWQHLRKGEGLLGQEGLRTVMRQLRGVAVPGAIWEREVLPLRLASYDPDELDDLCQSGELVWAGLGRDPRRARFRFLPRGEGRLFLGEPDDSGLSETARLVHEQLKSEGASFTADLGGRHRA